MNRLYNRTYRNRFFEQKRYLLIWALVCIGSRALLAQCGFTGLVIDASGQSSCELVVSSPGLPVLELEGNPYGLEPGDLIHFSYDTLPGPGCGLGLPASLSCVFVETNTGNGSACNASFNWWPVAPPDPYELLFQPFIVPPLGVEYWWDFGDGETAADLSPVHVFQNPGTYAVCLTVTDFSGCTNTYCDSLVVEEPAGLCDFGVDVYIQDLDLTAEVYNMTDFGPYHPQVVEWINSNTGEVLGADPILELTLPDSTFLDELCVFYQVEYPGGSICEAQWCGSIWGETDCIDSDQIQPGIDCPTVFLPVCGCDGVTYANACEAEYHNGVTSWTPGPCSGNYGDCVAYFSYSPFSDTSFLFLNTSVGDYTNFSWVIDGVSLTYSWSPCVMNLPEEGYHTICVKIWDTNTGCSSIYCQEIYSGDPDLECAYTDCVWPGDANGSGDANVYDLLNIGLGYGKVGLPRPDAQLGWVGQPAPSWGLAAIAGVDYKHSDCDGDGLILYDDLDAIDLNYVSGQPPAPMPQDGGLPIYFAFDQDTILVDEMTPDLLSISGGLYVGTPDHPAVDLHGLGLTLAYPQQDLLLPNSTTADYIDNSFFGVTNQSLWLHKDLYEEKKIELGFTRKAGDGANGYGVLSNIGFIIVSDIIGGRTEEYVPFEVTIEGIQVVDGVGMLLPYDLPVISDTVVFVNKFSANAATETTLEKQVHVFPNPAKDRVWAEWGEMDVESVTLFNTLGQAQRFFTPGAGRQEWSLEGVSSGLYTLQFKTSGGIVNKKLLVQ